MGLRAPYCVLPEAVTKLKAILCGYSQPSFAPPLPWTLALYCDMGKPALGFAKTGVPGSKGGGVQEKVRKFTE